jgi:Carboxypeptidase regulatory-like domain
MFFRTSSRGVFAVAAILFLMAVSSPAQEFRGTIIGTVSDRTGGVLPGVSVTVTNTETRVTQTVVTDAQGLYQVRYLNPGTYSVTAELQGFKKFSRIDNDVRVGGILRIDIALETGGMTETVEVSASSHC